MSKKGINMQWAALASVVMLAACTPEEDPEFRTFRDNWAAEAQVARVCRDGSYVWLFRGQLFVRHGRVSHTDPKLVCD